MGHGACLQGTAVCTMMFFYHTAALSTAAEHTVASSSEAFFNSFFCCSGNVRAGCLCPELRGDGETFFWEMKAVN
jgi:hypothetical protein